MHSLRFRDVTISWLNHTPHASAVYASCSALLPPHATLASQAACYGLTWAGLAPADRASFGWRLRILISFPPKHSVAQVIESIKRTSTIHLARVYGSGIS